MSPRGRHGCAAFHQYRKLVYPEKAHFVKRGIVANAVGVGEIVLAGPIGDMLLTDVLHVLELAGPLFSVKSTLDTGVAVHFDASHRFVIAQRSCSFHIKSTVRIVLSGLTSTMHAKGNGLNQKGNGLNQGKKKGREWKK